MGQVVRMECPMNVPCPIKTGELKKGSGVNLVSEGGSCNRLPMDVHETGQSQCSMAQLDRTDSGT